MANPNENVAVLNEDETPVTTFKPAPATSLKIAESVCISHFLTLPVGTAIDVLTIPDFWSLAAKKLNRWDRVQVVAADESFIGEVIVREVSQEHAVVEVLWTRELTPLGADVDGLPKGHSVQFLGSKRLWAVMRGDRIIKHQFPTKTAAANWLKGNYA